MSEESDRQPGVEPASPSADESAAAAGLGILFWSSFGKRKDAWIPLALSGAAGLAALGILVTRSGITGGSGSGGASVSISTSGTLLGWWLPLAAAIVATVVSVQRILKA